MIHHHEFWWRFFPKKELTQIYASVALRGFAVSMIGLFIPIYLLKEIGLSLNEVLTFFIFYSVVFAVLSPIAAKFASKYGVKHSVLFAVPLYLIFVLGLYSLPNFSIPPVLIASTLGASQSFYWMGMHLAFFKASHNGHRGEEVGKQKAMSILATIAGPAIGGVLIAFLGFPTVFLIASFLLVVATVDLFLSGENHVYYKFSMRQMINRKHWRDSLFFVSAGSNVIAQGVIWPLFIFVTLKSYVSLGFAGSLLSVVSATLVLLVGKYSDRRDKKRIIRWVSGFEMFSWFFRALATTVGTIYAATIFGGITYGIRESPLSAMAYDKADGDVVGYFVSREIFLCLGRILLLSFAIMTSSLAGSLAFQGFASLGALLF